MKKLSSLFLAVILSLLFVSAAWSVNPKSYGFIVLTGGGTGALDAIDGAILNENDIAIGVDNGKSYTYQLDATSGLDESVPGVISPNLNAGTKRWILRIPGGTIFTLTTAAPGSAIVANSLDTLSAVSSVTGTKVLTNTDGTITWEEGGGSASYPSAGVAISTGSAWDTSKTAPAGALVGTTDSQQLSNKTFGTGMTWPTFNQDTTGTAAGLTAAYIDWESGTGSVYLNPYDKHANITLSNGNMSASATNSTPTSVRSSTAKTSGKWYWEVTIDAKAGAVMLGVASSSASVGTYIGIDAYGWSYHSAALKTHEDSSEAYGAAYTTADVIGVAWDADDGILTFYKNNSTQGDAYASGVTGTLFPTVTLNGSLGGSASTVTINYGATAFTYSPPSGYSAYYQAYGGASIKNKPVFSGTNTGDQNTFTSIAVSGQTTVTAASTTQALTLVAGDNITLTTDNTAKSITIDAAAGGGEMVYPGAGIGLSTGSAWGSSITNNSANWNTAYDDRLKWDGGSTGLTAATGRTSLGLGSLATLSTATVATGGTGLTTIAAGSILAANSADTLAAVTSASGTKYLTNTDGTITWGSAGTQNSLYSIAVSGQTTVTAASPTQALTLVAGTNVSMTTDNTAKSVTINAASGGGEMVYPGSGIALSTGSAWGTSITNNSTNWDTAYTDRLKWDGGATGLTAATGRTSLGLGSIALLNADIFNAEDYAGSDTQKIQAAIDAAEAVNGTVYIPPRVWNVGAGDGGSMPFTITADIKIVGAGPKSYIESADKTNHIFSIQNDGPIYMSDMTIAYTTGTPNTGKANIYVTDTDGDASNLLSRFNRLWVINGYYGIHFHRAAYWVLSESLVQGAYQDSVLVENEYNNDEGDSTITGCLLGARSTAHAEIFQRSSGGLRIINNKLLSYASYGYILDRIGSSNTSILLIEGNSIEHQDNCIAFTRSSGALTFSFVKIIGNELVTPLEGIHQEGDAWISNLVIANNVIAMENAGPYYGIAIDGAEDGVIEGNSIVMAGGTGIQLSSDTDRFKIGINHFVGATANIANSSATSYAVELAGTISLNSKIHDIGQLTPTTNYIISGNGSTWTTTSSPTLANITLPNATGIIYMKNTSGTPLNVMYLSGGDDLAIGDGIGAGNLFMNIDGTMKNVTLDAEDSCGSGYKCVRVPN